VFGFCRAQADNAVYWTPIVRLCVRATSRRNPLSNRRLLTLLSALLLALGLATAVAGPGVASGTVNLTASNPAIGAVRLTAHASSAVPGGGVMVFELEGHPPVTVPLGHWAVVGSPHFDQNDVYTVDVDWDSAVVDIPGLDPTGTYRATATYVPAGSDPAYGDSAEVTTTLSVTRTPFVFIASAYKRWPSFGIAVLAYPDGKKIGTISIVDITTGRRVMHDGIAVARVADVGSGISTGQVTRGIHQFRATFIPFPALRDTLTKTVVTSPKIRFPG
jgi:hypothetical protein